MVMLVKVSRLSDVVEVVVEVGPADVPAAANPEEAGELPGFEPAKYGGFRYLEHRSNFANGQE